MKVAAALGGNALLQRGERPDSDIQESQVGYGTPQARPIYRATTQELRARSFPAGSMGPKVEAVCRFVEATGAIAAIGRLDQAGALLDGTAGTTVVPAT